MPTNKKQTEKKEKKAPAKKYLYVLHGKKGLKALYKDNVLVCTLDKFSTPKETENMIKAHAQGLDVRDAESSFATFGEIPQEYHP